jgi:hypothetical protein
VLKEHNCEELGENLSAEVVEAVHALSHSDNQEGRGVIYTRLEVVDFILDLVGYTIDQPLFEKRLLEPSFGGGEFLFAAVQRLLASWRANKGTARTALRDLGDTIRAVELHHQTFLSTSSALVDLLKREGLAASTAKALADRWLVHSDFLLTTIDLRFDFVVGNPPYVRQELIPAPLIAEYRRRYTTLYDRADLYIPFLERSLQLLSRDGTTGVICSDRWLKNKYGGPLRKLISEEYHFQVYVDMVGAAAFNSEVMAYPAITVFTRDVSGVTRVARRPSINREFLTKLAETLRGNHLSGEVRELTNVAQGMKPWLLGSSGDLSLIRRLEQTYPVLEEVGCKVGIGVATGADRAFIGDFDTLDVEEDRKVPLVTTKDLTTGHVQWTGKGVINPYADEGGLVDLKSYPKLNRYLEARRDVIAQRHCAKKTPSKWYRTIDRITPALTKCPKLLIPDIKGQAHVVFENGQLYPHHNLYFVTSVKWDLRALQAVLLSSVTRTFVETYSTKMRGGYFRFQAQYLRRLRIPHWKNVPVSLRKELKQAAMQLDISACNLAVAKLYELTQEEQAVLNEAGVNNGA